MMSKERPIIMTPENAQKCFDGVKTQTRRIVKPQPNESFSQGYTDNKPDLLKRLSYGWSWRKTPMHLPVWSQEMLKLCPYGIVGDRLWIREAFTQVHPLQAEGRFSLPGRAGIPGPPPVNYRVIYRGQGEYPRLHFPEGERDWPYRELCLPGCQREHVHPEESYHGWNPSIHMPRWACRTVVQITNIQVQRVQDISEEGAKAEGCAPAFEDWNGIVHTQPFYKYGFKFLWESIHGPGSWALNLWVWVIAFRKVTT